MIVGQLNQEALPGVSTMTMATDCADGKGTCMCDGGLPVPPLRLENCRDGFDDGAHVRLLEEAIRIKEAGDNARAERESAWVAEAKAAVPGALAMPLTELSRDRELFYLDRTPTS